jgi:DNA-binding CsgD family transcriptional regulator
MPLPIRLTRANDTPVLAQLLPLAGQARDLFSMARTLLLLSPVGPARAVGTAALHAVFDLTSGEARVARLLATGMAAKPIAAALCISENAVRFHIKAILSKNGFKRQAEFVAAAATISVL